MKPSTNRFTRLFAFLALFGFMVAPAAAQQTLTGSNVVVNGSDGPVTATGGTVTVDGPVNGSLTVFSGNLIINAPVNGDVTAFSGNIQLRDEVTGSVESSSGTFHMAENAVIGGNLDASGGDVTIDGNVEQDATIAAERLVIGSTGVIAGDLQHATQSFQNQGEVQGNITELEQDRNLEILKIAASIGGLIGTFLIGLILVTLLPGFSSRTAERFSDNTLGSFLRGLLAVILIPVLMLLLAFTIIGIPLAIIGVIIYILALWGAGILGAYSLGVLLLRDNRRWMNLAVGVLAFWLIGLLPILGGLIQALVTLTAFGAMISPGVRRARDRV